MLNTRSQPSLFSDHDQLFRIGLFSQFDCRGNIYSYRNRTYKLFTSGLIESYGPSQLYLDNHFAPNCGWVQADNAKPELELGILKRVDTPQSIKFVL